MSILSVQHVSYIYENTKQPVLKDISVDFEMGEIVQHHREIRIRENNLSLITFRTGCMYGRRNSV